MDKSIGKGEGRKVGDLIKPDPKRPVGRRDHPLHSRTSSRHSIVIVLFGLVIISPKNILNKHLNFSSSLYFIKP